MKSTLFYLLLSAFSFQCLGQINYNSKRYYYNEDLKPYDFELNNENGTIVVGKNEIYNSFCTYQNEDGIPVWSKKFIPGQGYMDLNYVIRLYDSTFLLVGTMRNPITSKHGAACIRMNQFGDTIWAKTIDNISLETIPKDVLQLQDSNILVTGSIHGYWSFAFKLDLNGNEIWGKTYVFDSIQSNWAHEILSVKEHDNGQLVFAGRQMDQNGFSNNNKRGFVMKTDLNGEIIWSQNLSNNSFPILLDDVFIEDSFYYFLNISSSNLIKTDSSLNVIWAAKVANTINILDETRRITVMQDSSLLIASHNFYSGSIQRISQSGTVLDAAIVSGKSIKTIVDKDNSILILNEGPLSGQNTSVLPKHFGVYKVDSMLNSNLCVFEGTPFFQVNTINVYSNSLVWQDQLGIYNTTFTIEDIILNDEDNCVELLEVNDVNYLNDFQVFPVPFQDEINVRKSNDNLEEFIIYDLSGRVLLKGSISGFESKINTRDLQSGNYFLYFEGSVKTIVKI